MPDDLQSAPGGVLSGDIEDPLDAGKLEDGIALALSGGGFKAAMYHTGAIIRLNEIGVLHKLRRVSSVSGGSLTAGVLGLGWRKLQWKSEQDRASAVNLSDVLQPLIDFCATRGVDVPAVVIGLVNPFRRAADEIEECYREHLFEEATLQDLPEDGDDAPRFIINATNLNLNSLWRFSRSYAADARIGAVMAPKFSLAKIVAASSGFPPFFSPVVLDLAGETVISQGGEDRHFEPYTERVELADAGIYDNMGIESLWKRYRKLLVCNAGDPTRESPNPPDDWPNQLRRTISFIHRQAENNRVRWLIAMAKAKQREVAYFPLRGMPEIYKLPNAISLSSAEVRRAQEEEVRLWKLEPLAVKRLIQHGYAMADAAVRRWIRIDGQLVTNMPAAKFPEVKIRGKLV
jgi:NTE family protein